MEWETPSFIDLSMNAEIGAYQDDFEPPDPLVGQRPVASATESATPPRPEPRSP